ncbi:MAG TPA: hypothetical protein VF202_10545 [Trueperaceae bacterium]
MTAPDAPPVESLTLTLEEARRRHDAASAELQRLCEGKRFHMSIPAQPDDSDVILGDALQALKALTEGHDLVPRDPTAELVEALEAVLHGGVIDEAAGLVSVDLGAYDAALAVLARVKGEGDE